MVSSRRQESSRLRVKESAADEVGQNPSFWRFGPEAVACVATLAVLLTISPAGDGPGISCDECYDVWAGKQLVHALRTQQAEFFTPDRAAENFGQLASHPPLGRWALGAVHGLFECAAQRSPIVSSSKSLVSRRRLAFGVMVLIVGRVAAGVAGPIAGTAAAMSIALMPRVFAHCSFCHTRHVYQFDVRRSAGRVGPVAQATRASLAFCPGRRRIRVGDVDEDSRCAGARSRYGRPGWLPQTPCFASLGDLAGKWLDHFLCGLAVALVSPARAVSQSTSARQPDRQTLTVFYLGRIWNDVDVPWHYPWIMLMVTVPLGLILLGIVGWWTRRRLWITDPVLSSPGGRRRLDDASFQLARHACL